MKKIILSFATVALLASCGGNQNQQESVEAKEATKEEVSKEETTNEEVETLAYTVDTENSTLQWEGDKVVGDGHVGVVAIQGGKVHVEAGKVVGGEVVVDMANVEEINNDDEESAKKLVGHLMSEDFFKVEAYPTSKIVLKSVNEGNVTADLTIKDVTKEITFPAEITVNENNVMVKASFAINRTDWGVIYGSGNFFEELTKDKVIKDQIKFDVDLTAAK